MIILEKSWEEFKQVYGSGGYYFDEDLDADDYVLTLQRNSMVGIVCRIGQNETANVLDYETNYQSLAGSKEYLRRGYSKTLTVGAPTTDVELLNHDDEQVNAYLYCGYLYFGSGFSIGNGFEVTIRDPLGVKVGTLIKDSKIDLLNKSIPIAPPMYDYTTSKKLIPAGYKIRVSVTGISVASTLLIHTEYEY